MAPQNPLVFYYNRSKGSGDDITLICHIAVQRIISGIGREWANLTSTCPLLFSFNRASGTAAMASLG